MTLSVLEDGLLINIHIQKQKPWSLNVINIITLSVNMLTFYRATLVVVFHGYLPSVSSPLAATCPVHLTKFLVILYLKHRFL